MSFLCGWHDGGKRYNLSDGKWKDSGQVYTTFTTSQLSSFLVSPGYVETKMRTLKSKLERGVLRPRWPRYGHFCCFVPCDAGHCCSCCRRRWASLGISGQPRSARHALFHLSFLPGALKGALRSLKAPEVSTPCTYCPCPLHLLVFSLRWPDTLRLVHCLNVSLCFVLCCGGI